MTFYSSLTVEFITAILAVLLTITQVLRGNVSIQPRVLSYLRVKAVQLNTLTATIFYLKMLRLVPYVHFALFRIE